MPQKCGNQSIVPAARIVLDCRYMTLKPEPDSGGHFYHNGVSTVIGNSPVSELPPIRAETKSAHRLSFSSEVPDRPRGLQAHSDREDSFHLLREAPSGFIRRRLLFPCRIE